MKRPLSYTEIKRASKKGSGGAVTEYIIRRKKYGGNLGYIKFQEGGIKDHMDVNGVTNENLLQIVIDRLRCFQKGKYPCEENECALAYCNNALKMLELRTKERIQRGVEGKETK